MGWQQAIAQSPEVSDSVTETDMGKDGIGIAQMCCCSPASFYVMLSRSYLLKSGSSPVIAGCVLLYVRQYVTYNIKLVPIKSGSYLSCPQTQEGGLH